MRMVLFYGSQKRGVMAMGKKRVYCIDTETTGFDFACDEVIQLAVVDVESGETVLNRRYGARDHESWDEAAAVNGIYPEDVAGLPSLYDEECGKELLGILAEADILLFYNACYDALMLMKYAPDFDFESVLVADAMVDYRNYYGKSHPEEWMAWCRQFKNKKLGFAASEFGYEFDAHDALNDVRATIVVWRRLHELGADQSFHRGITALADFAGDRKALKFLAAR